MCQIGQFRDKFVAGLDFLAAHDTDDNPPRLVQAVGGVGQFVLDGVVEALEFVAGDAGVHVVLDVVVHVPIQKLHDGIEVDGAGAQAVVFDFVLEPDVLGVVAQKEQHAAIKWREGNQHRQHPPTGHNGLDDYQGMPHQQNPGPVDELTAPRWFVVGEERALPIVFELPEAQLDPAFVALKHPLGVDDSRGQEAFERDFDWQNHFHVIGLMQRVFVVLLVAGPKVDVIEATNKAYKQQEKPIDGAGFEHRIMTKLVEGVEQKGIDGAMQKQADQ